MKRWCDAAEVPADLESVVTIGVYDGVHRGHQAILNETIRQARERGVPAVVLTFDPHPVAVHLPDRPVAMITSLEDRLDRLEAAGIDGVLVQHYTLEYAAASPEGFVRDQLLGVLGAQAVVVGHDVRFGAGNCADGDVLVALGEQFGFDVTLVDDLVADNGRRFSSSWIRELLAAGDVAGAAKVLGRPHRIVGEVSHGFQRGRELGFPTANLHGDGLGEIPADGVYAGWLIQRGPENTRVYLPAAISVGTNPQFNGEIRTVEAHVLGRSDLNLYGERVAVEFIEYVRPMMTFDSLEGLLERMDEDLRVSADVLGVPVSTRVDPAKVTAQ
ncbi:riboflavin kinase/FMN adenylyltransferase [Arcanobacterium wilhelmae]|uniref:Riboflavin biosynthesis protein n=1 Tax=Arcanobacterium wilhelmae TaxID=1803177 RepID=A0ABT9N9A7_9ACTO|nr:bifunctional riboflavin kinase/FAD synthetase [Arcanobacterium wilhelmae]MDP9800294.1 riboflavin kinase/FMN adenylyltransferase [Arcanobacterium wilhelmae]WFN89731.1 bifunctional riboflavin kinase/FAD synthetase [Arcanobacterium wilhelmae]